MMKRNWCALFAGIFMISLTILSCKKDDNKVTEDKFNISGNANGAAEVPAVTTDATGTITGKYDAEHNTLDYTITWTGLSGTATNMHFHGPADASISAGVQIGITGFPAAAAGTVTGTATLTDAQETDLLAGKWYYNIHTAAHAGGEIRGNITATHQ